MCIIFERFENLYEFKLKKLICKRKIKNSLELIIILKFNYYFE